MTYAAEVLADSPTVYWRLGEPSGTTAADSSGNGHTGTYVNAPTLGATGLLAADANTAVGFTGASSQACQGTNTVLPIGTLAHFTLECLFNIPASGTGQLITIADPAAVAVDYIELYYDVGVVHFDFRGTGGDSPLAQFAAVGVHHLAGVFNGTALVLYVDGVAVDTRAFVDAGAVQTVANRIAAAAQPGGGAYATGVLDEVAFYPSALSAARVLAHAVAAGVAVAGPITVGPTVRLVTSRALAVPHQVQRWVLPIICKRFANIGPDDQIETQQDVAAVREFFLGLRRSGTPVAFQEGTSRHLVVVRDVSFPDGMVEQWGNQRDGMEGLLMVTVDSTQG